MLFVIVVLYFHLLLLFVFFIIVKHFVIYISERCQHRPLKTPPPDSSHCLPSGKGHWSKSSTLSDSFFSQAVRQLKALQPTNCFYCFNHTTSFYTWVHILHFLHSQQKLSCKHCMFVSCLNLVPPSWSLNVCLILTECCIIHSLFTLGTRRNTISLPYVLYYSVYMGSLPPFCLSFL